MYFYLWIIVSSLSPVLKGTLEQLHYSHAVCYIAVGREHISAKGKYTFCGLRPKLNLNLLDTLIQSMLIYIYSNIWEGLVHYYFHWGGVGHNLSLIYVVLFYFYIFVNKSDNCDLLSDFYIPVHIKHNAVVHHTLFNSYFVSIHFFLLMTVLKVQVPSWWHFGTQKRSYNRLSM